MLITSSPSQIQCNFDESKRKHLLTMNETFSLTTREIKNRNCPKCPLRWFPGSREAANSFCNLIWFWNNNCLESNAILWTEKHLQNSHRNYFNNFWIQELPESWFADKEHFLTFLLKGPCLTFFQVSASSTTSVKDKDKEHLSSTIFICKLFLASEPLQGHWVWWWWWWWFAGGGERGWAAVASSTFVLFLLFKHIWFDGQSRTFWSVHNYWQIVFRNNKAQKVDTIIKSAEEKFVLGLRLLGSTAAAFKVLCSSWHPAACTVLPLLNSMMMF